VLIGVFAVLHAIHLRADFPNHSPWAFDWAKYTDEGWWGNAAVRAHVLGNWYVAGDFNPAVTLPVLPFLEWVLFFATGATLEAARGLTVSCFFASLLLSYLLVRERGSRWAGLLAVTLMVTSPFLYCFSRLAILEPVLMALTLGAMNLAVRLPAARRPAIASIGIGLLVALMMLTKTTAVFLLPAVGWILVLPLRQARKPILGCMLAAVGTAAICYGLWMGAVIRLGLLGDYRYLFLVNAYPKPKEFYWPLISAMWSFHGGLWADHILIPLAGLLAVAAALAWGVRGKGLFLDPVFGASVLGAAGYIAFMAVQNHPQPRYFTVVAFFSFIVVALGAEALVSETAPVKSTGVPAVRIVGWAVIGIAAAAAGANGVRTVNYALHPEYAFVNAAEQLTQYIDAHPNGRRLLVSSSGDQISLVSHLPALCDDFGTEDLPAKLAAYQPGWYASWNDLDPDTLEDLHTHYSLEQVAVFHAFDDPDRNQLVLFKLHPLAGGRVRSPGDENLRKALPDDSFEVPVE
jgi:Dolichyl-phosphate-mannose-protein mannosyltransferase